MKKLLFVFVALMVFLGYLPKVHALEGGFSLQPGMTFIENETSSVRKYAFAGAVDIDFGVYKGLFADFNFMYFITSVNGAGGRIEGYYPSFGAKYKLNIKDKYYPFAIAGVGPYYHYAVVNSGLTFVPSSKSGVTKLGMNVGGGVEIMFSDHLGMDFTVKQYFVFAEGTTLKIITAAPGFKVKF